MARKPEGSSWPARRASTERSRTQAQASAPSSRARHRQAGWWASSSANHASGEAALKASDSCRTAIALDARALERGRDPPRVVPPGRRARGGAGRGYRRPQDPPGLGDRPLGDPGGQPDDAAGASGADHLGGRAPRVGGEDDPEDAQGVLERAVRDRQRVDVADHEARVDAGLGRAVPRPGDQAGRPVDAGGRGAAGGGGQGEVAGPAGDVQHPRPGPHVRRVQQRLGRGDERRRRPSVVPVAPVDAHGRPCSPATNWRAVRGVAPCPARANRSAASAVPGGTAPRASPTRRSTMRR